MEGCRGPRGCGTGERAGHFCAPCAAHLAALRFAPSSPLLHLQAAFNMWLAEKSMAQRVEKQRYALMTRLSAMSATYQSDINEQIAQRRERAWAHNFSALESGSPTFERPRPLRRRKGVDEVGVASAPEGGCSPARSLRMHMQ